MKIINLKLLLFSFMFLNVSSSVFAQDEYFYIFLAFGQSNMEGFADFEEQDTIEDDRFKVLQAVDCENLDRKKGQWYPATAPITRCQTGISPADYFGRTLTAHLPEEIKIGIINVSVAGTKMALFQKDNEKYVASSPDWLQNKVKEYDGDPYGRLIELAKIAQKDGVIKGILLHQGESDTGDQTWPVQAKGVYDNILNDLGLEANSLPLLAGEMVSAEQGGKCASMNTVINTLPDVIPQAHVISSTDCEAVEDGLHFSAAGYRELGKRYGMKMLSLLEQ
ncbi:sialate O-acetylesterase [Litoribacter alkaliphilus]|uniref:Sialate O-acetylesterase n=1 Tax=Litoribacter ruber TaxID=702568 RepID=A0AAP2G3S1_9BACT|nr:sialate O-acetylesterase [Litoribacter alkaliphilus]MBS9522743.1 sialate O-acetylesterase [Litoribacter alkaliphilus]